MWRQVPPVIGHLCGTRPTTRNSSAGLKPAGPRAGEAEALLYVSAQAAARRFRMPHAGGHML